MRTLLATLLALVLAFAGCLTTEAPDPEGSASPTEPTTPRPHQAINGTIWFPPPSGPTGATLVLPLNVSAGPATVDGRFEKQWAPTVDAAADAASAMVRLQDAQGDVHGEVMLPWNGPRGGGFTTQSLPVGDYELVFTLYGWSDGRNMGHHLTYHLLVGDAEAF